MDVINLTQAYMERNKRLADDLKAYVQKHAFIDVSIYFNEMCYRFSSNGSCETIEGILGSDSFKYANDKTVSMSFEGTFNHILNGYISYPKDVLDEFNAIFQKHGCYYELGYAWSLSTYFD